MSAPLWPIYELQPVDVGRGYVTATQTKGILNTDCPQELHPKLSDWLGTDFVTFLTTADGACGGHGVWGGSGCGSCVWVRGVNLFACKLLMNA